MNTGKSIRKSRWTESQIHGGCSESTGSLNFCRASSTHNSRRSSPASTRRTGTVLARPFDTLGGGCCGSPFRSLETEYGAVHDRRWTLPGSATIQVCSSVVVPAGGRASSRTSIQTVKLNSSSRGNGVNRAQAEANLARQARNCASRSAGGAEPRSDKGAPGLDESSFLSSKVVLISPAGTRGKPDRSKAYRSRGWLVRRDEMMILTAVIVPFKISVPTAIDASLI